MHAVQGTQLDKACPCARRPVGQQAPTRSEAGSSRQWYIAVASAGCCVRKGLWQISAATPVTITHGDLVPSVLLLGLGAGLRLPAATTPSWARSAARSTVADDIGGATGALLSYVARSAFMSRLEIFFAVGGIAAFGGVLVVLAWLPSASPGRSCRRG